MAIFSWISGRVFNAVHRNNLVYNTCWEDPRLDRVALQIGPQDNILVITSAGCNALDYALCEPESVHGVDLNPRQNALLELKKAAIRRLEYDDFYKMFGDGQYPGIKKVFHDVLKPELSEWAQKYWSKRIKFFDNPKGRSFFFRGTSGTFAHAVNIYADRVLRMRPVLNQFMEAKTLEEQRELYSKEIKERFWRGMIKFAMRRDFTLSMVGVPKAQRRQIEMQYEGGITKYVEDCVDDLFMNVPIADNYFWRVYATGKYTPDCCPEYVKEENFQKLKGGLIDRVHTHTMSVEGFLREHKEPISRFVLLDHMDWLSDKYFPLLESEWQAIIERAAPASRVIWRSGGLRTDFVEDVHVIKDGKRLSLPELLTYDEALAAELHPKDRVHTYGSFYIASMAA